MDLNDGAGRVEWLTRLAAAAIAAVLVLGPLWYFGVIFPPGRSGGDLRGVERVAASCARTSAVCARTLPGPTFSPGIQRDREPVRQVTVAYDTADFRFGYLARVTIRNSGDMPIKGWTLRMRLRTGALIGAKGASVSMSPEGWMTAVNTPATALVQPGASVSFTYTNDGDPDWNPTGCTINGSACSDGL